MKDTIAPSSTNRIEPSSPREQLSAAVAKLRFHSAIAICEIEQFAARVSEVSQLRALNELSSSLEIIEAQIDYYFPGGDWPATDLGNWANLSAFLNAETLWLDEQTLELGLRFDSERLPAQLEALSQAYAETSSCVIAARFDQTHQVGASTPPAKANQRLASKSHASTRLLASA